MGISRSSVTTQVSTQRPFVTAVVRFWWMKGVCWCFPTGELAGGLQCLYLLCCRTWQWHSMQSNSCLLRRNLHLRISLWPGADELFKAIWAGLHLYQIEFWFKPTLINPPCLPLPSSSVGGEGKESAWGPSLPFSRQAGSCLEVPGGESPGRAAPFPGSRPLDRLGFRFGTRFQVTFLS